MQKRRPIYVCLSMIGLILFVPLSSIAEITQNEAKNAALGGNISVIQQAIMEGYQIDSIDEHGRTLLMYAAFNGRTELVEMLLKSGAEINTQDVVGSTPLMFAASGPVSETVEFLIKHEAKINLVDKNEHFSALMWAAAEGQVENVEILLKAGADPTLKDVDGDTAESFAMKAGHIEVVEALRTFDYQPKTEAKPHSGPVPDTTESTSAE